MFFSICLKSYNHDKMCMFIRLINVFNNSCLSRTILWEVNYCNNKLLLFNYNYKLWQLFNEFKRAQIVSFFIRDRELYFMKNLTNLLKFWIAILNLLILKFMSYCIYVVLFWGPLFIKNNMSHIMTVKRYV